MDLPNWQELNAMHGRINILHIDSQAKKEKRLKREMREKRKAAETAEKEATYQIRLAKEVAAVQERVAYMQARGVARCK